MTADAGQGETVAELRRLLAAREAERDAAAAREAALAEVLAAINRNPGNLAPVFDTILEKAHTLCGATIGALAILDGDSTRAVATRGLADEWAAWLRQPVPLQTGAVSPLLIAGARMCHWPDVRAIEPRPGGMFGEFIERTDIRTMLFLPLRKEGAYLGWISALRTEVRPFAEKEIALLENFAAQAVIAMENARLLTEQREALERQTATIDVLKTMSASPGDAQPVFDLITAQAQALCNGANVCLFECDGTLIHCRSVVFDAAARDVAESYKASFPRSADLEPNLALAISIREGRIVHVRDTDADGEVSAAARRVGVRSGLMVPLLKDGGAIGAMSLASYEAGGFTDSHVELLKTFAEQAVIAITSAETWRALQSRTTDLQESLEYQTAISDVLKVISRSTFDLQPVLDSIMETAARICDADMAFIFRRHGDIYKLESNWGFPPEFAAYLKTQALAPGRASITQRTALEGRIIHVHDMAADPEYALPKWEMAGVRTGLGVPLTRDGVMVGVIDLARRGVRPFSERQIELVATFADQAVIAIENTRLLTEQREALDQQTATAEILRVINASPGDLTPVFDTILAKAHALCGAELGSLGVFDGQFFRKVARYGYEGVADEFLSKPYPPLPIHAPFFKGETVHIADVQDPALLDPRAGLGVDYAISSRLRVWLEVPLWKDGTLLGTISGWRREPRPFSEKEIKLLQSFADQAVLAMENARLLTEQREALERQTAMADLLAVINASPGDPQPVFDAILQKAHDLCDAESGALTLCDEQNMWCIATLGLPEEFAARLRQPFASTSIRAWNEGMRYLHIPDLCAVDWPEENWVNRGLVRYTNARTRLIVPMRKDGRLIGLVSANRPDVRAFVEQEISLLESFAAQAVIAMENARLLREQREALERQTATAEVLRVINENPGNLVPVFDAMLEKAALLCDADCGSFFVIDDDTVQAVVTRGLPAEYHAELTRKGAIGPQSGVARVAHGEDVVHLPDMRLGPSYLAGEPFTARTVDVFGLRTWLGVPLRKDGIALGLFAVCRFEVRPFTDRQIDLLKSFAAQAVIAMDNARLLTEQREALERQTAMAEVLQVINANPGNLTPVFDIILSKAHTVCGADIGSLILWDGRHIRNVAILNYPDDAEEMLRRPRPAGVFTNRLLAGERFVHIPDILAVVGDVDQNIGQGFATRSGVRTSLVVPLRKDGAYWGMITANRREVRPYNDNEISLLENFAAQAVIAMDNARLLNEIRQRQSELDITFENMGDGVAMFDHDQKLAAWNRNFQEILDLPDDAVRVGLPFADYIRGLAERGEYGPDANADEQIARLTALLDQANRFERIRPNGHVIDIRQNPIPDGGFVIIYADITERKRAEEALRAARDEAEAALRDLKLAQANLIQAEKMASLGQLTAGIAHEIKNPLNFVNNFSDLSVDLLDELHEAVAPDKLNVADDLRAEIDDITATLKTNLEKIAQHGRRADSIVKNMLLHSRTGPSEHRPIDLNATVEEALNLAYHGARAETPDFNITLERHFDPAAGTIDAYPQEFTRVMLNLMSNGFYAARKRAAIAPNGFAPTLTVTTANLGDTVKIGVRDNGTGMPDSVRDRIFEPFFTTKPAGEGTGLGLSLSFDIVVKQHGGQLTVDSELERFTEFTVTLPRRVAPART